MAISLVRKIYFGFILVAIVGLIGNFFMFFEINILDQHITTLTDIAQKRLQTQTNIKVEVMRTWVAHERLKNALLGDALYADQLRIGSESEKKIMASFTEYDSLDQGACAGTLYDDLKKNVLALLDIDKQIFKVAADSQKLPDEVRARNVALACLNSGRPGIIAAVMKGMDTLSACIEKENFEMGTSAKAGAVFVEMVMIITSVLVLALALVIGFMLGRSINSMISKTTKMLSDNSATIQTYSRELAAGSQSLAASSTEQATAIEKISSALEQISSMVKSNADNATQANKLVTQTGIAMDATQKAMQRSLAANEEISKASNETSKIIKTIDEIAFQTNLLSLNAAVEAARAGEAGAGFAVVAGEVRGLSMRSAEASKRTAELIEQTIAKVREGAEIFAETGKNFEIVVDQSHKIQQLVNEVAAASEEQNKGIEQIGHGVVDMEKGIQQTAAHSEQTAASTEELATQTDEMITSVHSLEEFIFGSGSPRSTPESVRKVPAHTAPKPAEPKKAAAAHTAPKPAEPKKAAPAAHTAPKPAEPKKAAPAAHTAPKPAEPKKAVPAHTAPKSAEQVIPLDASDMDDF